MATLCSFVECESNNFSEKRIEVCSLEIAIASIHRIKVGAQQACPWQANPLQKPAGNVDSHQRNTVLVQFLQSFDPAANPKPLLISSFAAH